MSGTQHGTGSFIPGSVRIVDYNAACNTLLVRGGAAFGAGNFTDPAQLLAAIEADPHFPAVRQAGIDSGKISRLVDICLIGFGEGSADQAYVAAELDWFTDSPPALDGNQGPYPTLVPLRRAYQLNGAPLSGAMLYWPVQSLPPPSPDGAGGQWTPPAPGSSISPQRNGPGSGFDFQGLIPALQQILNNYYPALNPLLTSGTAALNDVSNALVYVHCDSGVNRTGAAILAYLMTWGSNLAACGLPHHAGPVAPLAEGLRAVSAILPGNAPPAPGQYGADLPVVQAYGNYLLTGAYNAPLDAEMALP
ncbi:hypothetical protein GALL_228830 [mine drainage metagenome]|uniref:Tyrosine specific protein phosphatases domain-containing protein n=1 Tax=mine drainage metagenome TaxID=410659 RepID=A0A1J5RG51_9ZZZZ